MKNFVVAREDYLLPDEGEASFIFAKLDRKLADHDPARLMSEIVPYVSRGTQNICVHVREDDAVQPKEFISFLLALYGFCREITAKLSVECGLESALHRRITGYQLHKAFCVLPFE